MGIKRILGVLLLALMLGNGALCLSEGTYSFTWSVNEEDSSAVVTGCTITGEDVSVLIPDEVWLKPDGEGWTEAAAGAAGAALYPVKGIGQLAFRNKKSMTAVTLPEGLTEMGVYAFGGCSGLTSVTLPEGLTRVCF